MPHMRKSSLCCSIAGLRKSYRAKGSAMTPFLWVLGGGTRPLSGGSPRPRDAFLGKVLPERSTLSSPCTQVKKICKAEMQQGLAH